MKIMPVLIIIAVAVALSIGLATFGDWAFNQHFYSSTIPTMSTHTFFTFMLTLWMIVGGFYAVFVLTIVISYYYNLHRKEESEKEGEKEKK